MILDGTLNVEQAVEFACRLGDVAREVSLEYFGSPGKISAKAGRISNIASAADTEAEERMVQIVQAELPDFGVVREEGHDIASRNGYRWVLDPIDGSSSFVIGRPVWGTLIALESPDRLISVGILDLPALRQRYIGAIGRPTTCNGQVVHANTLFDLEQTAVLHTTPHMFTGGQLKVLEAVEKTCPLKSVWGGDCSSYALLAGGAGVPLVVLEADMQYYDFAALIPVIKGAGGMITNWQGSPLQPQDKEVLACSNPALHQKIVEVIAAVV